MTKPEHVTVCICTYQRPILLRRTLAELAKQGTGGLFTFSVVVADNDAAESARRVVNEMATQYPVEIIYCAEPRRSISLARNKSIEHSKGDAIAFIDDDEFPAVDWLRNLYETSTQKGVAGVLGPVRPYFDAAAPDWVKKGGFYYRPEHATGFLMPWQECRTGNVLFHRRIIEGVDPIFRPEFGTGGGDVDFFRRMMGAGHRFLWCNEAVVEEVVPPNRWKRSVLLKRALLRGQNSFRHPSGRGKNLAKAVLAIPLYAVALPFLQLGGHHLFMKYMVKFCDHSGRLLAALGINAVREREM